VSDTDTDNADIVRSAILAQNRGDEETMLAAFHAAIEFHTTTTGPAETQVVRGRDALLRGLEAARQTEGGFRITLHEVEQAGDEVFVVGSVTSERGMRMPRAWIWQLRDGKVVRVDSYTGRVAATRVWQERRA
jgi:ketosteroid isomerase-like protein